MRTLEGITVGKTVINFETIRRHLRRDPSLCEADIDRLTNPSDTQDVPLAIEFIEAVDRIGELSKDNCTPAELQELVQNKVGTTKFTEVYGRLRQNVLGVRRERKTARAVQATKNPALASKRKAQRNLAKKESRKRKNIAFAEGRGKVKRRRDE